MAATCTHRLCELIGGTCSLAVQRSRGCRPGVFARSIAPEVFDEVRGLLRVIEEGERTEAARGAAARLAQIIRAEALEERNLVGEARDEDPELAARLATLVARSPVR